MASKFRFEPGGQLFVESGVTFDHETTESVQVPVQVSDASGQSSVTDITVMITDVNEPPILPAQELLIPESAVIGDVFPAITVSDPEGDDITICFANAAGTGCTTDGFNDGTPKQLKMNPGGIVELLVGADMPRFTGGPNAPFS